MDILQICFVKPLNHLHHFSIQIVHLIPVNQYFLPRMSVFVRLVRQSKNSDLCMSASRDSDSILEGGQLLWRWGHINIKIDNRLFLLMRLGHSVLTLPWSWRAPWFGPVLGNLIQDGKCEDSWQPLCSEQGKCATAVKSAYTWRGQ